MYAHRQAYNLSSFMIHLPGQSLPGKVSHMVDARFPMCECNGADEQLRLLTLTFRLRLYLVPGWYAVQESADGFPNFKAPVETSTSPQKTSVAGSFPDISGGQTNFLVCFLTGFNYTRMIFRVKDISKKVQTVQFFLTCTVWNMHSNFSNPELMAGTVNTVSVCLASSVSPNPVTRSETE